MTANKRDREVQQTAKQVKARGAEMLLIEETLTAAEHAYKMQWINQQQLADVKKANEQEQAKS